MDLWGFKNVYDLFGLPETVNSEQLKARILHWYWAQQNQALNG